MQQIEPSAALQTAWRLYGTLGCHLCEQAEQLLHYCAEARNITWQIIDIAELDLEQQNALAAHIPVLTTATTRLNWPFALPDLIRLADSPL